MKKINIDVIKSFKEQLDTQTAPIALIPHINADGDAIGSMLGLAGILRNAGKQVVMFSPNHFPHYYKWMNGAEQILICTMNRKKVKKALAEAGMMICLDFNQPSRAGEMKDLITCFPGKSILIDHHPYPQDFTGLQISHPECSSTAELVFHTVKAMGYEKYIDENVAEALYCGIMTDTGSFDYNISDPQTFQTVGELLSLGIDPEKIHEKVFDNYSADRMRLLGYCLSECMEIYPEYYTAIICLPKEVQQKYNFLPGDNEGFVNYPLSISHIHFSVLFTEKEDHVKISFRSKGQFPANEIAARHFNGGGHMNASGGELFVSFAEALARFREVLPEYRELLEKTRRL